MVKKSFFNGRVAIAAQPAQRYLRYYEDEIPYHKVSSLGQHEKAGPTEA
jgi:hypothetical protein